MHIVSSDHFLQEGLRTLCVAYKKLTAEEYSNAQKMLQNAKLALQDREKKLAEVYEKIERDFILLGATAVEDRLVLFLTLCLETFPQSSVYK